MEKQPCVALIPLWNTSMVLAFTFDVPQSFSPNKASNSSLPVYSRVDEPTTLRWKDPELESKSH